MTDELQPADKNSESPVKLKARRFSLETIALTILVIVAAVLVVGGIWLWQQTRLQQQSLKNELSEQLNNQKNDARLQIFELEQKVSQQNQNNQQLQLQLNDLQQSLNQLKAPAALQQSWQQLNRIIFQLQLAQNYLMAGMVNAPIAAKWIQQANAQLQLMNDPIFTDAQSTLADLNQKFKNLSLVNVGTINHHLIKIGEAVDQLTALASASSSSKIAAKENTATQPAHATSSPAPASLSSSAPASSSVTASTSSASSSSSAAAQPDKPSPWYQSITEWLKNAINQMIVVRHQQTSVLPLSLQQKQWLNAELKVSLLQARLALIQQNQSLFDNSLQHIHHLLTVNFDDSNVRALAFRHLQQITRIELNPALPSFDPIFKALNDAQDLLEKKMAVASPSSLPVKTKNATAKPVNPTSKILVNEFKNEIPKANENKNSMQQPDTNKESLPNKIKPKVRLQTNDGVEI